MERTHRDKAVTSIQQGPRYVGARKKIPPLGANCPQTENHGAVLLSAPQQSSFLQLSILLSFFLFSYCAFTAVILYCDEVPGQRQKKIFSKVY